MPVWKFLLRLLVGAALIGVLLYKHQVGLPLIVHHMAAVPLTVLAIAVCIELASQALCAYRWAALTRAVGHNVSFQQTLPIYFSGMFFNMCLPTSIGGDAIRVVGMGRHTGSKASAMATVFMDRNVGLAALLIIGTVGSLAGQRCPTIEATLWEQHFISPLWPFFILLCCGYAGANMALFSRRWYRVASAFLIRIKLSAVEKLLEKLHLSLQEYRQSPASYVWPFIISIVYQLIEISMVAFLASAINIHVTFWVFCALVPFQAVASLLPITFNGVGVREGIFCAVLMGQLGPHFKDEALALSLIYFFGVVMCSSLVGGLVYIASGMPRPTATELTDLAVQPVVGNNR